MITQTVTVTERNTQNIIIGRRGTYNTEEIVFDLAPLISQFGDGTAVLLVKRSVDASAYPAVTERNGSNLVWTISDTDTYYKGHGKCELYWYVDGGLAKTAIWSLTVLRDLGETTEAPPDPYETWVDTLVDLGAETLENAQAAEQSASDANGYKYEAYGYARGASEAQYYAQQARDKAVEARQGAERARDEAWEISSHYPTIIDGYWAVWHDGQYWKTSYKAEGVDGRGIADVTGVKSSTSGLVDTYTLTVTYTDGDTDTITFTVTNGRDGTDGTDGVSPGVTITDITGGHRVTITDKDHPTGQSFDVMDGEITQADLDAALATKAPVIIDTASGSIASFSDGADGMPIKALTVSIEPQQDLHGQSNPYPAGGGVNKLPPMVDGTYTGNGVTAVVKDGIATLSGTTNASGNALIIPLAEEFTVPSQTCYLHSLNSMANGSVQPSYELTSDPGGTAYAIALNPVNRIVEIGSNNYGHKWDRIRFYLSANITLSGTFSPMVCLDSVERSYSPYSNICPISGWTGLNLTRDGANIYNYNNATIYYGFLTTVDAGAVWRSSSDSRSVVCPCFPDTTYRIEVSPDASSVFRVADIESLPSGTSGWGDIYLTKSISQSTTGIIVYTTSETAKYLVIQGGRVAIDGGTFLPTLSVNYPPTVTGYHAYQGEVIPVSWQTEAGTVYGGYINLTNGVLTVDVVKRILTGNEGFTLSSASGNNPRRFMRAISAIGWEAMKDQGLAISNMFGINLNPYPTEPFGTFRIGTYLVFPDANSVFADATAFNAWLAEQYANNTPVEIAYELAQPVEYQLDPITLNTLYGQNNIFADCGDVSVDYPCDTKKYIEKLTAPTEDDMIANANIAANKFFMIGNTLYFSTAAIAQGATIVPGTNCNKVSLADALNTLNA